MGTFIRAVTGFAIALGLLYGPALRENLQNPAIFGLKAEIAAAQPDARLRNSLDEGLVALNGLLLPRNGTKAVLKSGESRAHALHS